MRFGQTLLDVGAAPGSWSQYSSEIVGDVGRVVAVDVAPLKIPSAYNNVTILRGDIASAEMGVSLARYTFHGVISDIAPRTTGNSFVDSYYIYEKISLLLDMLPTLLFNNGFALFKLFESREVVAIRERMKREFHTCYLKKPRASRASSKETYIIGFDYRAGVEIPA